MALGMLHVDRLMGKVSRCISAVFVNVCVCVCVCVCVSPKVTVAPQLKHIAVKHTSV
jgi:hypothetical protein